MTHNMAVTVVHTATTLLWFLLYLLFCGAYSLKSLTYINKVCIPTHRYNMQKFSILRSGLAVKIPPIYMFLILVSLLAPALSILQHRQYRTLFLPPNPDVISERIIKTLFV